MNHLSKKPTRKYCAAALVLACAGLCAVSAEELDAFRYGGGAYYTYDSNLFRIDEDDGFGGKRDIPSEQSVNLYALIGFDKTWSRQRFFGDFTLGTVRYSEYSIYDHDTQNIRAGWRGNFPREIVAGLVWNRSMDQQSFADVTVPRRNLITRDELVPDIDVPIVSNWHVVAGGTLVRKRNSNEFDSREDTDTQGFNGGLRYVTAYGNRFDLVYGSARTHYPNRDASLTTDNAYREQRGDVRIEWAFSGNSALSGRIGYVKREHDTLTYRDFSGPSFRLAHNWQIGGQTSLRTTIYREMGAAGDNEFDYAVTKGIKLQPLWQASDKISVSGSLEWYQRRYLGSLYGEFLGPQFESGRTDDTTAYSIRTAWQATRWLLLAVHYAGSFRESDRPLRDYVSHTVMLQSELAF